MNTRTKLQPQLWTAPGKEEKFFKIWESIKTEIQAMQQNERLRNKQKQMNTQRATLN